MSSEIGSATTSMSECGKSSAAATIMDGLTGTGILPTSAQHRKALPLCSGVLDYFPLALAAVAEVSRIGNEQHNPGQPLHWDRSKSADEADALVRHLIERGARDADGVRHSAKVAWRALALLQKEIEAEGGLMSAYHKIETLFNQDKATFKVIPGAY